MEKKNATTTTETTTTEATPILTLTYENKEAKEISFLTLIKNDGKNSYSLAINNKHEKDILATTVEKIITQLQRRVKYSSKVKAPSELLSLKDNMFVKAFNAEVTARKKKDMEDKFKADNVILDFKHSDGNTYSIAVVPKYTAWKTHEAILFKTLDKNSVIAIVRDGDAFDYKVTGNVSSKSFNKSVRDLQAEELEGLTKSILNATFNGKSWEEALNLCKKCTKYSTVNTPSCLKELYIED